MPRRLGWLKPELMGRIAMVSHPIVSYQLSTVLSRAHTVWPTLQSPLWHNARSLT